MGKDFTSLWATVCPAAATSPAPGFPPHQLVGDVPMVLSGHAFPNGRLHQPRQGREHVDGGIDLQEEKGSSRHQDPHFFCFYTSTCLLPSPRPPPRSPPHSKPWVCPGLNSGGECGISSRRTGSGQVILDCGQAGVSESDTAEKEPVSMGKVSVAVWLGLGQADTPL